MTPLALEQRQHPARDADDTNDTPIKDSLVPLARSLRVRSRARILITETIPAINGTDQRDCVIRVIRVAVFKPLSVHLARVIQHPPPRAT